VPLEAEPDSADTAGPAADDRARAFTSDGGGGSDDGGGGGGSDDGGGGGGSDDGGGGGGGGGDAEGAAGQTVIATTRAGRPTGTVPPGAGGRRRNGGRDDSRTARDERGDTGDGDGGAGPAARAVPAGAVRRRGGRAAAAAAVAGVAAVAASPIVVAAVALAGDTWVPMSDWASLLYRVQQVGTSETPLVGPYSFHGFAHPGPLSYWTAAPLYRMTGEDPRALLWTGAIVNVVAVAALAAVAWRRGRWPLLLGLATLAALLVHGFGPDVTVDVWNPYVALLPFLLAIVLAWDAALGRRRAALEALVPASFAVQAHLAFGMLTGLVAAWLVAWTLWGHRLVGPARPGAGAGAVAAGAGDGDRTAGWRRLLRPALAVLGLLWIGPLVDAALDLHNPINVAKAVVTPTDTVGPAGALGLAGDHVQPGGPWLLGGEPMWLAAPPGLTHALPLVGVGLLLAGCVVVARRRGLVDVAALATLSATLVVGAVAGASQFVTPTASYLTEWLKLVGGMVWFTAGWTAWRWVEPAVRPRVPAGSPGTARGDAAVRSQAAAGGRQRWAVAGLAGVALAALVAGAAWSWPDASRAAPPHQQDIPMVRAIRAELRDGLAQDRTYRVELAGDTTAHFAGLIYWMIHDGYDVVTRDGAFGLKWGHDHRWSPGDPYDAVLTVVPRTPWTADPYERCRTAPDTRQVVAYDKLTPAQRSWLLDAAWRRLGDPGALTAAESRRVDRLAARDFQVGIFVGPQPCGGL
jgi:hypothetical protein